MSPEPNPPGLPASPFVSNSTNFEDVLLHRLFAGKGGGLFVDVGAGHPRFDNDTFALYELGWCGINVEPSAAFFELLESERPRDRNLRMLLSDQPQPSLRYFEIPGTGLSTCDEDQARAHADAGLAVRSLAMPVATLAEVLSGADTGKIDLLKVDVEGWEEKVLRGNDWTRFRPRLVLVEATYPNSPVRRPTNIRDFMQHNAYRHVYFDGLNDYFAEAGFEVGACFDLPPNVFDGFVRRDVVELQTALRLQRAAEVELEAELSAAAQARDEIAVRLSQGAADADAFAKDLSASEAERNELTLRLSAMSTERDAVAAERDTLAARLAEAETTARQWHVQWQALEQHALGTQREAAGGGLDGERLSAGDQGRQPSPKATHAPDPEALIARLTASISSSLATEGRRLELRIEDLKRENDRLRRSAQFARAEILELNQALATFQRYAAIGNALSKADAGASPLPPFDAAASSPNVEAAATRGLWMLEAALSTLSAEVERYRADEARREGRYGEFSWTKKLIKYPRRTVKTLLSSLKKRQG